MLLGASGCNPIATYRNWTGISANDPNPATTPNTQNLAAGEERSYPNLATVPPPPNQALTTAELEKLTQNLIADRAHAKYTSEHLQASFDEAGAPPPPPPPPAPPAPAAGAASPATPGVAKPGPTPPGGSPGPVASSAAIAGPTTPAATGSPGGTAGSAPAAAAGLAAKNPRKSGQPPEPGPMESRLQSPQIASLPQAEQNQPAPPPPHELSIPAGPKSANATAPGAHLPAPPAPEPMPAAIGSAKFQPAPPPPNLPPPTPIRTASTAGTTTPAKPAPPPIAFDKIADISFTGDQTTLTDADQQTLDNLLPRYRAKPGLVRVVGYAGVGTSATQQLNSYRTALDRAEAVAKGLAKAGIPASKIAAEAAPVGGDAGQGRAEILFAQ